MRVYRNVCVTIWHDDRFTEASDDCQLIWFHIFTNPLSTPFGIVTTSLAGLAADKNRNGAWTVERYTNGFQEAIKNEFFEYDPKALLVYFPKFFSLDNGQNHPQSINAVLSWGEKFKLIPRSPLKDKCYESIRAMIDGKGQAFHHAFAQAFGEASPMPGQKPRPVASPIQEQEQEQEQEEKDEEGKRRRAPENQWFSIEDIRQLWNKIQGVKPCKILGGQLRIKIMRLVKEHPASWWKLLFMEIEKSNFLCGRAKPYDDRKPFKADLDWATGPINLGKILSGKYDDSVKQVARVQQPVQQPSGPAIPPPKEVADRLRRVGIKIPGVSMEEDDDGRTH